MQTNKVRTATANVLASVLLTIPTSSAFALDAKQTDVKQTNATKVEAKQVNARKPGTKQADPKQVDTQLAFMLDQISKAQQADEYEKLEARNTELRKYLKTVSLQKQVMNDPLKQASDKGLTVLTSDDKKVRCYSWDTLTGGTMHFFNSMIVYDAGNSQLKCDFDSPKPQEGEGEGDPGATFENIDTIKTTDGKTVYLVRDLFIGSGMDHGRTINAYVISNRELKKCTFFQAGKKQLDSISFAFGPYGDGTEFEITRDKKMLKVPIIKAPGKEEPGSGTPTGKFLNYYFDGTKFVFKKQ